MRDLRCGMSLRENTQRWEPSIFWTGGVGDEAAAGGCRDYGCRCRCLLCSFPLRLTMQVREQRCARSSLGGGTRSKVVDSVLAVASVVRTVVLGV
jgi:hypothetical protein